MNERGGVKGVRKWSEGEGGGEQREGSERAWEDRRVEARGVKENGDGEWGRE